MEQKLSCGIVVVRKTDDGWCTILLRAYHHWDFPKGIREPGEEPEPSKDNYESRQSRGNKDPYGRHNS